ncbi:MAG: hypothetical protein HZB38_14100 [Planctomycetes bacterium]|nr:hypothetical protein [Planctomycetota bacterium]
MAAIHVLRKVPGGGHASAAFLIDTWCMGLKDAWGALDATYEEFVEKILQPNEDLHPLAPLTLKQAREMVAGGLRFAEQNGFRHPARYERWTALIGGVGDWREADISAFGCEGRLRCLATMQDLKRRLVGCRVEDFLARDDIDFEIVADDFTLLDDNSVEVDAAMDVFSERFAERTRQWCLANGQTPSPCIAEASQMFMEAIGQSRADGPDAALDEGDAGGATGESDASIAQQSDALNIKLQQLVNLAPAEAQPELSRALDQLFQMIGSSAAPEDILEPEQVGELVEQRLRAEGFEPARGTQGKRRRRRRR